MLSRFIGRQKEQDAKAWLQHQGIKIIAENFICRGGELDLIGLEKETLVCFEVRYRKNTHHGSAAESITAQKLMRLQRCFLHFIQRHPQYRHHALRIDALVFEGSHTTPRWIRNITG